MVSPDQRLLETALSSQGRLQPSTSSFTFPLMGSLMAPKES